MTSRYAARQWQRFTHRWNVTISRYPQEMVATFLAAQGTTWFGLYTAISSTALIAVPPSMAVGWICSRFSRRLRQPVNLLLAAQLQRMAPALSQLKISPLLSGFAADERTTQELQQQRERIEQRYPITQTIFRNASKGVNWLGGSIDRYGLAYFLSAKGTALVTICTTATMVQYGVDVESILSGWGAADSFGDNVGALAAAAATNVIFVPSHFYLAVRGVEWIEQFAKGASPHIREGYVEGSRKQQKGDVATQESSTIPTEEEIQTMVMKGIMFTLLLFSVTISSVALISTVQSQDVVGVAISDDGNGEDAGAVDDGRLQVKDTSS